MTHNQVLRAIKERDLKDGKMEKNNRAKMLKIGLRVYNPNRIIEIDTGKIEGIENVVKEIISQLEKKEQIISLEGISGSGKSSTASTLAKEIKAIHFSFGEFFRYLTYLKLKKDKRSWNEIISQLDYRVKALKIYLYDNNKNISQKLASQLRTCEIEKMTPTIAEEIQKLAIKFFIKKISFLAKSGFKVVLEGRAFTLDFLPCDLRVKLKCSATIRARRRLRQVS